MNLMNPQRKARLKEAFENIAFDGEKADMREIDCVIDYVSNYPEAWYIAQEYCLALKLPTINHSLNAAITQLRSSL